MPKSSTEDVDAEGTQRGQCYVGALQKFLGAVGGILPVSGLCEESNEDKFGCAVTCTAQGLQLV